MRVTPQAQVNQAIRILQQNNAELAKFQTQVSSGRRLLRPSDGPSDFAVVTKNKAEDLQLGSHLSNIEETSGIIELSVGAMLEVRDIINRANVVTLEANSSANNATNEGVVNEAFATEIEALFDSLVAVTNEKLADGRHLFGGTATDATPFTVTKDDKGQPISVQYNGTGENTEVILGKNLTADTFLSGEQVFQASDRATTVYSERTGVKAGRSVDTKTGTGTLYVGVAGQTDYDVDSGVTRSVNPLRVDTIDVGVHTLTISGGGSTVQLNNGTALVHGGGTDVMLTDENGQSVFLNASGELVDGEYVITRGAVLSTDGQTFAEYDTAADRSNVAVTDADGKITFVDVTNDGEPITLAGKERLHYLGSTDIFETLINLRDDLRSTKFSGIERADALALHLTELERIGSQVLQPVGVQSAKSKNLLELHRRTEDVQLELQSFTSNVESADIAEAIVGLQSQQNLFEIGLSIVARVNNLSLADFLR